MGFIKDITEAFSTVRKKRQGSFGSEQTQAWMRGEYLYPEGSGLIRFTPRTALRLPSVAAAVNGIADDVASLPITVTDNEGNPQDDNEATVITRRWTPVSHTAYDGMTHWLRSVLLYGHGAALVLRQGEEPYRSERAPLNTPVERIIPVDPAGVVRQLVGDDIVYYVHLLNGQQIMVERDRLLFLPFNPPFDGYTDRSPLEESWPAIQAGLDATMYAGQHFRLGAQPDSYIVLHEIPEGGEVKENIQLIKKQADEMRRGLRRMMVLKHGSSVVTGAGNAQNASSDEARTTAAQEVARIYDVSPIFIKDFSRATYQNSDQAAEDDAKTIIGWAKRVKAEMDNILWPLGDRRVEFDWDTLVERVFLEKLSSYAIGIDKGVFSRNDVRERLGLNRIAPDDPNYDEAMDQYGMAQPSPFQINAMPDPRSSPADPYHNRLGVKNGAL